MPVTDAAGGLVVVSSSTEAAAYSAASGGRRVWTFNWQPLTEVMAGDDVFTYPWRQDGACPLAIDAAAGLAYVGASDRVLYALELATGRPRWSWRSSQAFESVVAGGGRVLVSTEDYRQVALDGASGRLAWQLQFRRLSSPQTGVFGDVLVRPEQSGDVWGINATSGKVLWLTSLSRRRAAIVNYVDDLPHDPDTGLVFVSDDAGFVYAVHLLTGRLAWELEVSSGSTQKRVNAALFRGRLVVINYGGGGFSASSEPRMWGITAATGAVAWTLTRATGLGEGFAGSCGLSGIHVTGRYLLVAQAVLDFSTRYVAMDENGQQLWSFLLSQRRCASPPAYVAARDLVLFTTLSRSSSSVPPADAALLEAAGGGAGRGNTTNSTASGGASTTPASSAASYTYGLELTAVASELGGTCPGLGPDSAAPSAGGSPGEDDSGTGGIPPAAPPSPPQPPRSPPPPMAPGPDYCWRAQLSLLPLADPATDGERVFGQDNRGVAIGVDVRTGAVLWRSFACGYQTLWPGSPVVWRGGVYFPCTTTRVVALNASTGLPLWRSEPACPTSSRPDRSCQALGSYGHPALSAPLGRLFLGAADQSYRALDLATGALVWQYWVGLEFSTYGSSVGLLDGLLHAVAVADSGAAMKLLALNATDGTLVWGRQWDQVVRDNGPLKFVDGTLAVGTSGGQLRLFSVGLEGGDLVWSMPVTDKPIYGVERDGAPAAPVTMAAWSETVHRLHRSRWRRFARVV